MPRDGLRQHGRDAQPQVQAGVFSRHCAASPAARPRLSKAALVCRQDLGQADRSLVVEARLDGNLIERLMSAGHDVVLTDAIGQPVRSCCNPDGNMEGAHDPRRMGGAAGM